jgi:hypothetical protein
MLKLRFSRLVAAAALSLTLGVSAHAQKSRTAQERKVQEKTEAKIDKTVEKARAKDRKTAEAMMRPPGSTASAKAVEKIEKTNEKAREKNAKTVMKAREKETKIAARNATARCNDGTFTRVLTRDRACSGHRGVAEWLRR